MMADGTGTRATVEVWDRFVRLFHWGLVGLAGTAAVTGFLLDARWIDVHVWAGTCAAALVGARVIWGFTGPRHARFADFVAGPARLRAHLTDLRAGRVHRHFGHNPLGGLMMLALMAVVLALALTGTLTLGGALKTGPAAFALSFAEGRSAKEIHELLAWGLLALVALHVGGALYESRRSGENLVRAMIDGQKQADPFPEPGAPVRAEPGLALLAAGLGFAAVAAVLTSLSEMPAPNLPVTRLDPTYADECAACHEAWNPSLLPRATWARIMATLDDHFGEDASLDPATTTAIAGWLYTHSAETADTKAANLLRRPNPEAPLSITATPFWTRTHAEIAEAVFRSPAVGARNHCSACHRDAAAGLFNPSRIVLPTETAR